MNQDIISYIDKLAQKWQADICNQLRQIIHQAVPEVVERIQYGKPHFLKDGKYACVLGAAKGWVSLTIFNAQALETPEGMFESSDTGDRKTIKIREGQQVDYDLLGGLLQQAAQSL
jgi:hypothetical protein